MEQPNTTDALIDLISDHLQELNDNKEGRVKAINEFLDFLDWNLRITELSDAEKVAFSNAMEGGLSEKEHEKINSIKTITIFIN